MKIDIPDESVINVVVKDDNAIHVWRFHEAPELLQKLSTNGGDEDWLAFIPNSFKKEYIPWMEEGSSFGCCSVDSFKIINGTIKIGSHA